MTRAFKQVVAGMLGLLLAGAGQAADLAVSPLLTARAALEDGLYDIVQKQAEAVLASGDSPEVQRGDAVVLLAQALKGQQRYREMIKVLEAFKGTQTSEAGALVYWRAVAQYEAGNPGAALEAIRGFGNRFPGSPLATRATRLEAWCNLRANRKAEALAVFEQFDRQFGTTDEGAANGLDWGQALFNAGDTAAARAVFDRLVKREPALGAVQEGKLWLARALIAEGKWEPAWNLLTLAAADPVMRDDRRALALMALSEVNAAQTNLEAAIACASKAVEVAPTVYLKNRGRGLWGRWLLRAGKTAEGAAMLRTAIAALTEDPVSGEWQQELAATYASSQQPEKAAEEYQYYLETFSDPAGRFQAYRGRALALWQCQRYAEASTMFEKAAGLAADPDERTALLAKAADSLYANQQFKLAAAAYGRILDGYPSSPLAAQVLYQYADSLAHQSLWAEADSRFRELVRRYPGHPLAERALMRIAETREEQGASQLHAALAAYADVMNMYPAGALYAEALHRHGLVAYRIGEIDLALRDFSRVVNEFPKSPVAPQAYFMRGWALYMRGQEEESIKVFNSFVSRYPTNEWTTRVMFWTGEHAYNRGRFADAEAQFTALADKAPRDPMAEKAMLWAGRSAMMQKEYLRAVDCFSRLAKTWPASACLAEARFHHADALSELGEFSRAILILDDLLAKYPGSPLVSAAWGRRGDFQFTLGATDPKRYEEAVASYRSVTRSPGTTFDYALQAEFKIGRCLVKMGKSKEALDQYYTRVIAAYLAAQAPDPAAALWFAQAAFAVADLLELEKDWKQAISVLERVEVARVPASGDARKRIDQIRQKHWVW